MEDDLNFKNNGRRPQFLGKWKTTSILLKNGIQPQLKTSETNLNFLGKWETTSILWQNGKRPQFFAKWKTTIISKVKEDDLNFQVNIR